MIFFQNLTVFGIVYIYLDVFKQEEYIQMFLDGKVYVQMNLDIISTFFRQNLDIIQTEFSWLVVQCQ